MTCGILLKYGNPISATEWEELKGINIIDVNLLLWEEKSKLWAINKTTEFWDVNLEFRK